MLRKKAINLTCLYIAGTFLCACDQKTADIKAIRVIKSYRKGSYGYDAAFLKASFTRVIELADQTGQSKILLSADHQGRVMTSTAMGDTGTSFGWLNYALLSSKQKRAQFNPVGGEERFWLGPEGGQFSLYFKKGNPFNMLHWQVPALIDTVSYPVIGYSKSEAVFAKEASLVNYSGTTFHVRIERQIRLLTKQQIAQNLNIQIPQGVKSVGFQTINKLTNTGNNDWSKANGLLSVWLLGMFTPSAQTTVIIPFHPVLNRRSYITDDYFGKMPPDRLVVKDSVLYFSCDGKYRSKIGLSPRIAKPLAASFDFQKNVLTIIVPQVDQSQPYVNSKWEIQREPYKGDAINAYNDGPLADGTQMGPFYEIESSSPALALAKNQTGEYRQSTLHLQGDYVYLKQLVRQILGVDLDSIKQ